MNFSQILQYSLVNDENKYKSIIKDNTQLNKTKYESGKFDFSSCPITMEDFKEGDDIICLPCKHIFETNAIEQWVKNENASCPVCRFKLESKKVKITKTSNDNVEFDNYINVISNFMNQNLVNLENREITDLSLNELIEINTNFANMFSILENINNNNTQSIMNSSIQEENDNDLQMAIMASLNN
jgi:hypothetical protein